MRELLLLAVLLPLVAAGPSNPAAVSRSTGTLRRSLPELRLDGVPLSDAFNFLRDISGINLHVNWKALESVGVTQNTTVNLRLRQVSIRTVLNLLLSEAAPGGELAYSVGGGVVEITTREIADRKVYTVVYHVDDLLIDIPDFTDAPRFDLESSSNQSSGGRGGGGAGGGGQGLFGNSNSQQREEVAVTKEQRAQDLIDLIQSVIYPDVWETNGGPASIRYFNGNLIVTASNSVHEAIGGNH